MNIGDIINPVGSLLGGIVSGITGYTATRDTNKTNLAIARETNEANKNLAQYEYEMNLQQWNRENEYNSPAQQMARLEKAGLNPNLIYGNGQAVRPSANSPQYRAPEMKAAHMQPWSGSDFGITTAAQNYYAGAQAREVLANQIKQNAYLGTQNDYLKQQIVEKTLDIARKEIENARTKFDYDVAKELREVTIATAFANLEEVKAKTFDYTQSALERQERQQLLQAQYNLTNVQAREVLRKIDKLSNDIAVGNSVIERNQAESKLANARRLNVAYQNGIYQQTFDEQVKTIKQNLTNLVIDQDVKTWSKAKLVAEVTKCVENIGYEGPMLWVKAFADEIFYLLGTEDSTRKEKFEQAYPNN